MNIFRQIMYKGLGGKSSLLKYTGMLKARFHSISVHPWVVDFRRNWVTRLIVTE